MPEQQVGQAAPAEPSFREQVEQAEQQPQQAEPQQTEQASETEPQEVKTEVKEEKVVPLAALHAERSSNKELKRQLREMQAQSEQLQQQQVQMMRYMQSLQPQQPVPDPTQDPFGYQNHQVNQLGQQVSALNQQISADRAAQQQQQIVHRFVSAVETSEKAFSSATPDYYDAVNWAKDRKELEYQAIGMSEDDAKARIQYEAAQIADMALRSGRSPAETAYALAKQMGYTPKTVSAQQKLDMQAKGQQAVTPGGGGSGGGRLSLDSLAKLKGNDFLEATKGDNWRKLMSKA